MDPETAGNLAELAQYAVVVVVGAYAWLIGRRVVPAPGGRQLSDRQRWWARMVGAVGFGCGVLLVVVGVVRLIA